MGGTAVTALAVDRQLEVPAGSHQRTGHDTDPALFRVAPDVHAHDGVGPGVIQCTGIDHVLGTGVFLVRLEQEHDSTGDLFAVVRHQPRGRQQAGHVVVVAAGVHDAGVLGSERQTRLFLDGQRIDVGTHAESLARFSALQHADDACRQASAHFHAQRLQLVFDLLRRAEFLRAHFGMRVEIAAERDQVRGKFCDLFSQVHSGSSVVKM